MKSWRVDCFTALPAHPVGPSPTSISCVLLPLSHVELLLFSCSCCFPLSADIDMKKDIETLIAEERADIILKYATVSLCFQHREQSWWVMEFSIDSYLITWIQALFSIKVTLIFIFVGWKQHFTGLRMMWETCSKSVAASSPALCYYSVGVLSSHLVDLVVKETNRHAETDESVNSNVCCGFACSAFLHVWRWTHSECVCMRVCVGGQEYAAKMH